MRRSLLVLSLLASTAFAQVDPRAGLPVLLKVLSYDTNFESRGAGTFVILIVSEPDKAAARNAILSSVKDLGVPDIKKRPLKFIASEYKDDTQFQNEIDRARPGAILVVPDTSMKTIKALWELAQDNQLYALALDEHTVQACFPLGITMAGEKPQIVINEKSARAVGAHFETSVLRLAKVIQ